ncbi:uncharacterized protein LOC143275258 [Babylonia areolata]|uniref:uncharacterized protein LOC143275258 n=1 Tax=Babylonia areolata TaxID=304850 RepID=UPI003FD542AF
MANTPIHPWKVPGVPGDFSVSVKRDDLTGCALSGNKVRKLEFLLAEAVDQGCSHVTACGELQSNNCRAVAVCARQLGLTPHLFLRTDFTNEKEVGCAGNMLLNRLCGAHIYLVPPHHDLVTDVLGSMESLAQELQTSRGESCYVIPRGCINKTGLFGYIHVFEELRQQVCGGTAAELAIANYLTGGHLRLESELTITIDLTLDTSVTETADYVYGSCDKSFQEMGVGHLRSRDLLRVVGGFVGRGYGLCTTEQMEFIQRVAAQTSVVLDTTYSAKAVLGLVSELRHNPSAFGGRRVLYLHTGGLFPMFDGRMDRVLEEKEERQPRISMLSQ